MNKMTTVTVYSPIKTGAKWMAQVITCFVFLTFQSGCKQVADRETGREVSRSWIELAGKYEVTGEEKLKLLAGLYPLLPDSLVIPADSLTVKKADGGIISTLSADLDGDNTAELIGIFASSGIDPLLCVFKEINKRWMLVFYEQIFEHYQSPQLMIACNFSKHKLFYIHQLYERGSGVYVDGFHFYKLIDNKVYPCLQLLSNARIYGWGLNLNQNVTMDFSIGTNEDEIWATYHYNFFPGAILPGDKIVDTHEDISLIKGEKSLSYKWNGKSMTYVPDYCTYSDIECLNQSQIDCFNDLGNDSLFLSAFDIEIKQNLENGSQKEKQALGLYMSKVTEGSSETSGVIKKATVGSLDFYGPSEK